ncbi:lytic transglycosylase domain-containing protein [Vibrio sp. YIC-376]|uniref:lytic transglycosylase domain-containing protein n=1 Tax=Vibrio sp. YIC-376 TaxID=3136162 RepID=UPI00402AC06A
MIVLTRPNNFTTCYLLRLLRTASLFTLVCICQTLHAAPSQFAIDSELTTLRPYQTQIQQRLDSNLSLIHQIFTLLDKHKLPEIFILVPMLESSYRTDVVSHANAAGLWQLMPATAKRFGLTVDEHTDERFDTTASSQAAIDYLAFLYHKFEGNLALTLAAYNAGEGRIARAIKQANSRNFVNLKLPEETQRYVARFYALQTIININKLHNQNRYLLFLYGHKNSEPLVDLAPLPPLILL